MEAVRRTLIDLDLERLASALQRKRNSAPTL
jgi:hypothetical protein